jgi:hypothetical protein
MRIKYFTGNSRPDGSTETAEARVIRTIRGRKSREDFIIESGERIMHADVVEIIASGAEVLALLVRELEAIGVEPDDAMQRLLAEVYEEEK